MSRSQNDEHLFGEIRHWNFCAEGSDSANDVRQNDAAIHQPHLNTAHKDSVHNQFIHPSVYSTNSMLNNKHQFNMNAANTEANLNAKENSNLVNLCNYRNVGCNMNRVNNIQNYRFVNLGNGQIMRMVYDENNQPQLMIPVNSQYELFSQNQMMHDMPATAAHAVNNNLFHNSEAAQQPLPEYAQRVTPLQNNMFTCGPDTNTPNTSNQQSNSHFIDNLREYWQPNISGTYSPFGQNYPLNVPSDMIQTKDLPTVDKNITDDSKLVSNHINLIHSTKRQEFGVLADNQPKKRIVAEVKPMRPSYSDVLAKHSKNQPGEQTLKSKGNINETKNGHNKNNSLRSEKNKSSHNKIADEKSRIDDLKGNTSQLSSSSDNGEANTETQEKCQKSFKRNKGRNEKFPRKWSSLDNLTNEDGSNFIDDGDFNSQFVYIDHERESKQNKKGNGKKQMEGNKSASLDHDIDNDDENGKEDFFEQNESQFVLQESPGDNSKSKKKSKDKVSNKQSGKLAYDKKKSSVKSKKSKQAAYVGLVHTYMDRWSNVMWSVLMWFYYLVTDVCHMTLHLSLHFLTSIFSQGYISFQVIWRNSREQLSKVKTNKYLLYIDRKLGHTQFGFWRKLHFSNKGKEENEANDSSTKTSHVNIPLPATGDEAMKRLFACKGKDPYSILGVNVKCSDEDIKRYYRRQAFLVHPDKNQQPGAEEAFKILQHAFDLIGEPERREAYDRRLLESQHVEAAWSELNELLAQLHSKMEYAANTIRCTNCGRRHKRVITDRPCYAARYCSQCKIRHSAKEGDIWAESGMWGLVMLYFACMDGAVYQITEWASCQKKNLKHMKANTHLVQYRIVLGNKANAGPVNMARNSGGNSSQNPNLEEFLNNLYNKSGQSPPPTTSRANSGSEQTTEGTSKFRKRNKKGNKV